MKRAFPLLGLIFIGFLVSSACTLTIDLDQLENRECPDGQKLCRLVRLGVVTNVERCVPLNDPDYGCHADTCGKCNLNSASADCRSGECQIANCLGNNSDCDGLHSTGCEVETYYNVMNCGSCTTKCVTPNGVPQCSAGKCEIRSCNAGFSNCNQVIGDGCEASAQDCAK